MEGDRCPFLDLLFRWQVDSNLLSLQETEGLLNHLDQAQACPQCFESMRDNAKVLNLIIKHKEKIDIK